MKTILAVENEYDEMINIQKALAKLELEHQLVFARNNQEAMRILCDPTKDNTSPDIVILDADHSRTSMDLLNLIRSYYSLRHLKIFLLCSSTDQLKTFNFKELEIAGYLNKPLDFDNFPDNRALQNNNLFLNALMR